MAKELIESIEKCTIYRSFTSLRSHGNYLDEDDLREKYKQKPEQLKSLMETARTITHPTRKVLMYEDADISLTDLQEEDNTERRKRNVEMEEKLKPAKKPKTKAKAKGKNKPDEEGPEKPISKQMTTKWAKFQKAMPARMTLALTQQATATSAEYVSLIPQFQVKKLNDAISRSDTTVERMEAVIQRAAATKQEQDTLCEEMAEALENMKTITEKMEGHPTML